MNNAAMTFDAGTWWLIGLLVTALIGAVVFLVKRTLFSRVDELAKEVREIRDGTTKKGEYEKDQEKLVRDIEQIKRITRPGASMSGPMTRSGVTSRRSPRTTSPRRTSSGSRPRPSGSWT